MKSQSSRELRFAIALFAVIAAVAALILPVLIVPVWWMLNPTYMQPMVHEPFGILLLALGVAAFAMGCVAAFIAVRLLRSDRPLVTVLLALAIIFFVTFPIMWVVLLGPAILILMHPA